MFEIRFLEEFWTVYKKLTKGNKKLQKRIQKVVELLSKNPKYPSLKSHKVDTKKYDNVWSSWVTGDVRIIWAFDKNEELVILVLDIGTHSGANQVYKKKSS